jgi:hypothetical protein
MSALTSVYVNSMRVLCARAFDSRIVVDDLNDRGKRNLDDLAVAAFHFHARRSQRLGHFHTAHHAAHADAVARDNLDIVLAVKRLQCRQCSGDFHNLFSCCPKMPFETLRKPVVALYCLRAGFVNPRGGCRVAVAARQQVVGQHLQDEHDYGDSLVFPNLVNPVNPVELP